MMQLLASRSGVMVRNRKDKLAPGVSRKPNCDTVAEMPKPIKSIDIVT